MPVKQSNEDYPEFFKHWRDRGKNLTQADRGPLRDPTGKVSAQPYTIVFFIPLKIFSKAPQKGGNNNQLPLRYLLRYWAV